MEISALENLQTLNEDVMLELLGDDLEEINSFRQQFLVQAKGSLQKIADHYRQDKLKEIKEEAHYLKTSAKAIGAERCAYFLQELEDAALDLEKQKCRAYIESLSNEIKNVFRACNS
ncbi:Hpt domain-containing protein [Pseudoalteromonas sp. S16_S37]|uniref:Hpt domain-containing protein n=1 Tax=Pseudoalteromonas sp. S16_S37 TaxID=2720228 RepID=UPI001680F714|nr:Hpt domain-containing protein [Pseudoalteromonas sp. S16_S37]MBD1583762.1 Hpt domain-containing protein [Pseudoalteromonas sp. S16_S37]